MTGDAIPVMVWSKSDRFWIEKELGSETGLKGGVLAMNEHGWSLAKGCQNLKMFQKPVDLNGRPGLFFMTRIQPGISTRFRFSFPQIIFSETCFWNLIKLIILIIFLIDLF